MNVTSSYRQTVQMQDETGHRHSWKNFIAFFNRYTHKQWETHWFLTKKYTFKRKHWINKRLSDYNDTKTWRLKTFNWQPTEPPPPYTFRHASNEGTSTWKIICPIIVFQQQQTLRARNWSHYTHFIQQRTSTACEQKTGYNYCRQHQSVIHRNSGGLEPSNDVSLYRIKWHLQNNYRSGGNPIIETLLLQPRCWNSFDVVLLVGQLRVGNRTGTVIRRNGHRQTKQTRQQLPHDSMVSDERRYTRPLLA